MIIFCCKITCISLHTYVLLSITYSIYGYIYDIIPIWGFFAWKWKLIWMGFQPMTYHLLHGYSSNRGWQWDALRQSWFAFIYLFIYLVIYSFIHLLQARRNRVAEGMQSPRHLSNLVFFRLKQIMKR